MNSEPLKDQPFFCVISVYTPWKKCCIDILSELKNGPFFLHFRNCTVQYDFWGSISPL